MEQSQISDLRIDADDRADGNDDGISMKIEVLETYSICLSRAYRWESERTGQIKGLNHFCISLFRLRTCKSLNLN